MTDTQNDSIGFLTVLEIDDLGFCGGLLILNSLGRPLEFHCTVPVSTNRAQKILYGPTLRSFLFNEKIGMSLYHKAKKKPQVLVTNLAEFLQLESLVNVAVVQLSDKEETSHAATVTEASPKLKHLNIAEQKLITNSDIAHDSAIADLLSSFSVILPLSEPFGRISEAIMEAQAVAR
ncbi:hypothetical protein N9242_01075 [Vicingaceae bacterium]|nr:hypothetical protein [Vicingaceae bacterium]